MAGRDLSRFGFFKSGVIDANLKLEGKRPSLNDKFASLQIRWEKTGLQASKRDVGMYPLAKMS